MTRRNASPQFSVWWHTDEQRELVISRFGPQDKTFGLFPIDEATRAGAICHAMNEMHRQGYDAAMADLRGLIGAAEETS